MLQKSVHINKLSEENQRLSTNWNNSPAEASMRKICKEANRGTFKRTNGSRDCEFEACEISDRTGKSLA